MSRFSVENNLSHSSKKFRRGPRLCFTKFSVSEKFMEKMDGGSIRVFRG